MSRTKKKEFSVRDKRLDEIGVQINPNYNPAKLHWFLDLLFVPEIMALGIVIVVFLVFLVVKMY
ncbi:hypothetical protein HY485_03955 [Candidatus Woesearchaeota archaeon]|nr:hypothetical protein [Candidatus Woesearchaeota archaeon]